LETIFLIDNNGREAVKCAQTDLNQAEDICPARFFALSGPANHRINVAGKKKGRTMNPLIQSKNATILPVLIALTLGCFGLSPQARAVCQEGCDTDNNNTVLGDDALVNNTTGNVSVEFKLPTQITRGDGTLALAITDGGVVETISKTIPILVKNVDPFQVEVQTYEGAARSKEGFYVAFYR
jgi:hypothetical protein